MSRSDLEKRIVHIDRALLQRLGFDRDCRRKTADALGIADEAFDELVVLVEILIGEQDDGAIRLAAHEAAGLDLSDYKRIRNEVEWHVKHGRTSEAMSLLSSLLGTCSDEALGSKLTDLKSELKK